jgi:hypothetical protein
LPRYVSISPFEADSWFWCSLLQVLISFFLFSFNYSGQN